MGTRLLFALLRVYTASYTSRRSMTGWLRIFAMPMIPVTAARPLELPGICHPAVEAKKKCCKKYKDGKRCKDCPKR
jgi:hypothetical protein